MKDLVEVLKDDRGCRIAKSCFDCPYVEELEITIKIPLKCQFDYKMGTQDLVAKIRGAISTALFRKGVYVTVLASIFNISKPAIRMVIHRFVRRKE